MKKALMTFVKAPVPGTVKTRLQADLTKEKTVRLYKAFIKEILSECSRLKGIDRYLGCAPSKDHEFLERAANKYRLKTFDQRGKTLGEKIVNAFRDHFAKGYSHIVLIGSDSPTIPVEYIKKAFMELVKKDMVIGPCCDGGMYLIGARGKIDPAIFRNVPWDTSEVLNIVLEKLLRKNISFSLLPFWYDIDNIADLRFLKLHLKCLNKKMAL